MKYRNTKTGIVVEANCEIHGDCWEVVAVDSKKDGNTKPTAKGGKKAKSDK